MIARLTALAVLVLTVGTAEARTLYVRSGGDGNGTRTQPFGALADVERASRPGDRIVVRKGPGVLDGGIRLEPRQRLIGRPGARIANTGGDAVTLAPRTTVRRITVVAAARGGIYGKNVGRVRIAGNDVSGHNASCTPGFQIPPFNVPTTAPGVGVPIADGLTNGWAGILVDAARGDRRVVIAGNDVHDSECGDGIDVRAFRTARVRARIVRNHVSELRQGPDFESVLAFGLQTRGRARMTARLDRNRQAGLGNDEDAGTGPEGADSEGVFVNPVGASRLDATVKRNLYTHTPGRGGFSANGLEFVSMGDGTRATVRVRDSTFSGTPGDVVEQLALGTNARLRLDVRRTTATGSTGFAGTGSGNTFVIPGNNGDCLIGASGGAGNVVELFVRDTVLTDCANNGITFGSSVANGEGPTSSLRLDVARATITGNRGNNLRVGNVSGLDRLAVKVADSDLADAEGMGLTPANASFENLGEAGDAVIDLGGGALGSAGGNCLDGGSLSAALLRFDVTARGNWFGGGPVVRATAVGGTLDAEGALAAPPARCG